MEAEEARFEVIDIDLNEEPGESAWNYQEMSSNIESAYSRIEERIRRLEAVTMRARLRQERRLSVEVVNEEPLSLNEEIGHRRVEANELPSLALNSAPEGRLDRLKWSENHLLALALKTDGGVSEAAQVKKNSGEAFFDCNICLGKARDPILTCCGHLFCWPCFYLLPDVGPDTKECPECKGDVYDSGIIPIYGNSDKAHKTDADKSCVTIPPRPRANRIESLRQQRITRGSHSIRIEEVLRSLPSFSTLSNNLTSALNSAERLAEDLEGMAYLYQPVGRRYRGPSDNDSNSDVLVDAPSEALVPDANAGIETGLPSSTSIAVNEVAGNGMQGNAVVLLPRRISPRRIIDSQEHFTDLIVPRSRRGRLRRTHEQTQHLEQRRSSLRSRTERQARILQQLSRVFQSEENPTDAPMLIDDPELLPVRVVTAHSSNAHNHPETVSAFPEANETVLPSSIRRREFVLNTSEASGSGTPEPRRRRLE